MPHYKLELTRQAEGVLAWMAEKEPTLYERVARALDDLEKDPSQGKPLKGQLKGRFSYRVGSYRVIYVIHHARLVVIFVDIGHRRDIYHRT